MRILVTGGFGYKGAVLVPKLVKAGHDVAVADIGWFGWPKGMELLRFCDNIPNDIRNIRAKHLEGIDTVIHLASVANDPCANLNPNLTWDVIARGTTHIAGQAAAAGVRHFIYASSASVYGISDKPNVTEETEPFPLTVYNQAKYVAERALMSFQGYMPGYMPVTIVRPATVCGISPAMRTDLVVNLLTMQALNRGKITVLGGKQHRPNIHVEDITDLYCWLVDRPANITVNAGHQNLTVFEIASLIADRTGADVEIRETNDERSYRLDSSLLKTFGWEPKRTVEQAIDEMVIAHNKGELIDEDHFSRVNWMRQEQVA